MDFRKIKRNRGNASIYVLRQISISPPHRILMFKFIFEKPVKNGIKIGVRNICMLVFKSELYFNR